MYLCISSIVVDFTRFIGQEDRATAGCRGGVSRVCSVRENVTVCHAGTSPASLNFTLFSSEKSNSAQQAVFVQFDSESYTHCTTIVNELIVACQDYTSTS
jgi:hypothetical protein